MITDFSLIRQNDPVGWQHQYDSECAIIEKVLPTFDPDYGKYVVTKGATSFDACFQNGIIVEIKMKSSVKVFVEECTATGHMRQSSIWQTPAPYHLFLSLGQTRSKNEYASYHQSGVFIQGKVHVVGTEYLRNKIRELDTNKTNHGIERAEINGYKGINCIPYYLNGSCWLGYFRVELNDNPHEPTAAKFDLSTITIRNGFKLAEVPLK